uniref:Uncharacterized protein n=1 Tax=Desulfovibrio sp. U5L TaxID=596152 RepID=I2Q6W1_9BACT
MKRSLGNGLIALAAGLGIVLMLQACDRHEAGDGLKGIVATQLRKSRLVTQMLGDLLASVEAEKNAIVAGSDADSENFAAKAKALAEKVGQERQELLAAYADDHAGPEAKLLNEFSAAWEEFLAIDKELLGQAVLNTNLKAYRISASQAVQSFEDFERAIRQTVQLSTQSEAIGAIAEHGLLALGMTAKILAMQAPHIAEASDAKMDEMEREMAAYAKAARDALAAMRTLVTGQGLETLQAACAAFEAFEVVQTEVIRLSRINSNVKALALSMGLKRRVAARCEELLETLRETIDTRLSKATR